MISEKMKQLASNNSVIRAMFEEGQNMAREFGAEPFGFAEKAARSFLTIDAWRQYNWDQKFIDAKIEIELSFARSDA